MTIENLQVAWLCSFVNTTYRFWSGEGDLSFDSVTYTGAGQLIEISPAEVDLKSQNRRLTASLALNDDPAIRQAFMQDPGPLTVEVNWIYSEDNGKTWTRLPRKYVGRLSNPKFVNNVYQVELETYAGDVDRGRPRRWSDEDQRAYYPGDKGMEYMRELEQGIDKVLWPP